MAMKVNISFKEEEKNIYDYLMTKLSHSIFVKELIIKEMHKEEFNEKPIKPRDIMNF